MLKHLQSYLDFSKGCGNILRQFFRNIVDAVSQSIYHVIKHSPLGISFHLQTPLVIRQCPSAILRRITLRPAERDGAIVVAIIIGAADDDVVAIGQPVA